MQLGGALWTTDTAAAEHAVRRSIARTAGMPLSSVRVLGVDLLARRRRLQGGSRAVRVRYEAKSSTEFTLVPAALVGRLVRDMGVSASDVVASRPARMLNTRGGRE